jgi:tRNA(His) 5'-end guanylyltransferase
MAKDDLGKRMKENYEVRTRQFLPRRTNTIIRLDGKAFHTFTKGYERPFDDELIEMMNLTTKYLCENIQGCVMGYTQSDEITLVLQDYDKLTTDAWYDGQVQKIVSIAASMATACFNRLLMINYFADDGYKKGVSSHFEDEMTREEVGDHQIPIRKIINYFSFNDPKALFDARVFTIPERGEVVNNLIWRQQDAVRNSISMVAQSLYSHKELYKKSTNEMQEMIFQKGQNWNDLDVGKKRGRMVVREMLDKQINQNVAKKLKEQEDERLVWHEKYGYRLRVAGWNIKPAVDFSKNFDKIFTYLQLKMFDFDD